MQLTITITDEPNLPKEDLRKFFSVAKQQGKSPESLLIDMIKQKIAKRGKTIRKGERV